MNTFDKKKEKIKQKEEFKQSKALFENAEKIMSLAQLKKIE